MVEKKLINRVGSINQKDIFLNGNTDCLLFVDNLLILKAYCMHILPPTTFLSDMTIWLRSATSVHIMLPVSIILQSMYVWYSLTRVSLLNFFTRSVHDFIFWAPALMLIDYFGNFSSQYTKAVEFIILLQYSYKSSGTGSKSCPCA